MKIGNYYIDLRKKLTENSIVYSLGVGTHIDFDLELSNRFSTTVHLFDPTPESIDFITPTSLVEKLSSKAENYLEQ